MKTPTPVFDDVMSLRSYFSTNGPILYHSTRDAVLSRVRVPKNVAQTLLRDNESIIVHGKVYFFQIKHIGLDVYEVKLRDPSHYNTYLVASFEPHVLGSVSID
jgi:hypothetical protein